MAFEDVPLMRAIPGAIVVDPADSIYLEALLRLISQLHSVSYLRLYRREAVKIYET